MVNSYLGSDCGESVVKNEGRQVKVWRAESLSGDPSCGLFLCTNLHDCWSKTLILLDSIVTLLDKDVDGRRRDFRPPRRSSDRPWIGGKGQVQTIVIQTPRCWWTKEIKPVFG